MTREEWNQKLIVDEYIDILLSKKGVRNWDYVEIDDLNIPIQEAAHERPSTKVPFEVMRIVNGNFQLGAVYINPAEQYLLKDAATARRYWISSAKIKQLLYENSAYSEVQRTRNGSRFVCYIDRDLLLDNAEPES